MNVKKGAGKKEGKKDPPKCANIIEWQKTS